MDNFMDKLVEKINAQGAMRMQNMINLHEGVQGKGGQNKEKEIEERLKEQQETIVREVAESTASAVSETNARNAELFTEYKKQSGEELNKAKDELADHVHKESVKCYRNTQAVIEEKAGSQESAIKESIKSIHMLKRLLIAAVAVGGVNLAVLVVILLRLFRVI